MGQTAGGTSLEIMKLQSLITLYLPTNSVRLAIVTARNIIMMFVYYNVGARVRARSVLESCKICFILCANRVHLHERICAARSLFV